IKINNPLLFKVEKKVSEKRLLSFDFYRCCGFIIISPRLANLLVNNKDFLKDVQLLDANVIINGQNHSGFKALNILRMLSCIDVDKSDSEPLLANLPDSPIWFTKIVFKQDIMENFCMARTQEDKDCIVISDKLKQFFIENNVKGIKL
ncbi:imm11 family protein, partial [Snodgrassella communis]|uniref:imm11 family protein n=1 Tax=Snodgrassella communis TaxID=2946699 RepID=UPI001EF53FFF